jgi:hypothetical protein
MASFIYTSALEDEARGAIDFDTDTFKMVLLTSSYTGNQGTHTKRSDLTNEVTGTGYTAGGVTVAVTVAKDTTNKKVTLTFAAGNWASSTITARYAAVYKSRGGASSADELVFLNDFGGDVVSTSSTFAVAASTITKQL